MSQLTRDRLLAALGVPRASRDELGELSYEGRADLLGCKTRLSAAAEADGVSARCEMQASPGAPWVLAWRWSVRSTPDGRMRLAHSEHSAAQAGSSGQQAAGSIEEAKALARAAILQIRENPHWAKTGLACGLVAEMPRFADLAQEKGAALLSKADNVLPLAKPARKPALSTPSAIAQAGLFGDEAPAAHAFKR